jgi:hypothetical protein
MQSYIRRRPVVANSLLLLVAAAIFLCTQFNHAQSQTQKPSPPDTYEYLWYEAENMRGLSVDARREPVLNPSWANLSRRQAPGWGVNGPGTSAEWSQGGESEWNSIAASADEAAAIVYQDMEVPCAGVYKIWVRYADWAAKSENFTVRITQNKREVLRHEFGAHDLIDPHDETSMYWGWTFVWDAASMALDKGAARISIEIEKQAEARRHVDCVLLTNDLAYVPEGRRKPDFAALRYLRSLMESRTTLAPLIEQNNSAGQATVSINPAWRRRPLAGQDFLMPWNITPEFWRLYDKPPAERSLYPFNAEPVEEFVKKYGGAREVPIFASKLIAPVVYINDLPALLREGSAFRRYLRETRAPFAVLINYGSATMTESEGHAAWKLLNGELRDQFIGWISGESIGHVYADAAKEMNLTPDMSHRELLEAQHIAYTRALERKWNALFHTPTGAMWNKLIVAQSTSSTSFAHALARWGSDVIGIETSAAQPSTAMRIAFARGAARQYGVDFLYYHAPNFGDTATTFTRQQDFAGPDHFFHSRYGATMGPSLAWYRKSYYLYYMAGASAIYLEQGFDQFFKPGPSGHEFQLNPLGRITNEFVRFAENNTDRGVPYTPVAFLLDAAHGWDMTDYPQLPFGVSPINRSDRALRELFGAAYYPAPVTEGEPASGDRQAFVNGMFGDIFDVLVASEERASSIDAYRAIVVGGRIEWSKQWAARLAEYVRKGGVVLLNEAQRKNLPDEFVGARALGATREADDARCLLPNEAKADLRGGMFRYERIKVLDDAQVLMSAASGDPLVVMKKFGRGKVIYCALPDLLGEDERLTAFAAHLLAHLFAEATPVRITGDVQHLFNRTTRGWLVTLINNQGVFKPQQGLAQIDRRASVDVTLSLRGGLIKSAREWTSDKALPLSREENQSEVKFAVAPGGVAIIELITDAQNELQTRH